METVLSSHSFFRGTHSDEHLYFQQDMLVQALNAKLDAIKTLFEHKKPLQQLVWFHECAAAAYTRLMQRDRYNKN